MQDRGFFTEVRSLFGSIGSPSLMEIYTLIPAPWRRRETKFLSASGGKSGWGAPLNSQRLSLLSAMSNFHTKPFITNKIANSQRCVALIDVHCVT